MRHDRALPVAIHGMMPARAERGDGSEESLLDIESEGQLTVNRWGIAFPTVMSPRATLGRSRRHGIMSRLRGYSNNAYI